MTKYILAGGYMYKAPDSGKAFCEELVRGITKKPVKILDCMFTRHKDDWEEKLKNDREFFSKNIQDFELELALPDKFIDQVRNSDVIFIQGGVPYQFYLTLNNDQRWVNKLEGKTLVGTSGGADIIVKYYGVGRTLNIGEGLGLVPIKFIPHWKSDYGDGLTIDWDSLLEKLKSYKEDLAVHTLREGEFVVFT